VKYEMTGIIKKPDYKSLLDSVSTLIEEARRKAVKQVNTIIVHTYWGLGRLIVKEEQKGEERAEYGERVLKRLANDLTKKYGRGFSERNLEMMRKFYITYPHISQTLSAKSTQQLTGETQILSPEFHTSSGQILSWSHYCELITIKDDLARSFYEIESIKNFYLNYIKDQEMLADENPPVGIILCTEPNRSKVFVEYALGGLSNKLFVSKYKLYLPTKRELEAEIQKEATRLSLIKSEGA